MERVSQPKHQSSSSDLINGSIIKLKFVLSINQTVDINTSDYYGMVYLLAPLALYFALYITPVIGLPASVFLIYCITRLKPLPSCDSRSVTLLVYNFAIAAAIVINSGAAGPLYVNSDWNKHYAVFNELVTHNSLSEQGVTLRYYIAMYITPALMEKTFGFSNGVFLASWITLGLFIFLNQVSSLISSKPTRYLAPLVFFLFSGSDIIGTYITGYQRGSPNHLEWWAGWIEYSSPITSIFWAPQSTIPAWIAIALLMRRPTLDQAFFVYPLLIVSCILWSPFAALGITPYILSTLFRHDLKLANIKVLFLLAILLLCAITCYYLTFDVDEVPKHWVWNNPCLTLTPGEPCFTPSGYILFIFLEVMPVAAIALSSKASRGPTVYISIFILALLPLTQIGLNNDLAMNASKPALAALIIGMIISLSTAGPIKKLAITAVLLLGIATPASESFRSFKLDRNTPNTGDIKAFASRQPKVANQYLTYKNIWFIRNN